MEDDLVLNFNSNMLKSNKSSGKEIIPKKKQKLTKEEYKAQKFLGKKKKHFNANENYDEEPKSYKKDFGSKREFNSKTKHNSSFDFKKNQVKDEIQSNIAVKFHKTNKRQTSDENYQIIKAEQKNLPDIDMVHNDSYNPFSAKSFSDLKLNEFLIRQLTKHGYDQLTKVQKQAIPIMLEHKNVVVKSETGTGKTLAYVVPLYETLLRMHQVTPITRKDGVYCIIFAPTHELCLQIESTISKLNSCLISLVSGTLIGGQKIDTEKLKIRKGINVIVCTPGRLLYHLSNTKSLNFNTLNMIVFDEADILLDMGFEKDIKTCLKTICNKASEKEYADVDSFKKYKIFLLSATIDSKIRQLTSFLMKGLKQ